jgi:hypothetical protein
MVIIDALARYVAEDGAAFERAIMERERETEDFHFLYDVGCAEHQAGHVDPSLIPA